MTLRKKNLWILLLAFSVFAVLNYGLHHFFILPGFHTLQADEARKDMERCLWELKDEISHIDRFCHDLAAWDDLYEYVASPSTDFIDRNLNADTILGNDLSFICIMDRSGRVLFGEAWDLASKEKTVLTTLPEAFRPAVRFPLASDKGAEALFHIKSEGLCKSAWGPMMFSARPIVTSRHEGPVRGAVVVGRLLDVASIEEMTTRVALDFRLLDATEGALTPDQMGIFQGLDVEEIRIDETGCQDSLCVYSRLPAHGGGYLIKAEVPKDILAKGRITYTYSFVLITVLGLFMAALITALLKRVVLSPLMVLTRHVLAITKSGDLTARITTLQNDEIGVLGREVNRMLGQLESQSEEMAKMNQTLHAIIEASQVGILALREGQVVYKGNQRLADILGYGSPESMVGLTTRDLHVSDEAYREFCDRYFNGLVHGAQMQVEYELRRKNGSSVWCTLSGKAVDTAVPPDLEKGVVWMVDDISQRRQARENLKRLASTDPLTGLFNRRKLQEIADVELERQRRSGHKGLSLILLDIDYFKKINDTHGHAAGDLVLKAFAGILRDSVRSADVLARIGGEEFVALLPDSNLEGALELAERLRQAVEESPVRVDGAEIAYTISLGVATWGDHGEIFEALLNHADRALYAAKENGRNRVESCEAQTDKCSA